MWLDSRYVTLGEVASRKSHPGVKNDCYQQAGATYTYTLTR